MTAAHSSGRRHPSSTDAELESFLTSFDACYVWRYGAVKDELRGLYAKAKQDQWDGALDLDWSIEVDPEQPILPPELNPLVDYPPYLKMNAREQREVRHSQVAWQLSQFMHGEQGALLATAQIVNTVPWTEAKFYAAQQVADEARHVEVYRRYLTEKLGVPQKYNETITWFYLIAVAETLVGQRNRDFESWKAANPALVRRSPGLVQDFYSADRLNSPAARQTFLLPDRAS